MRRGIPFLTIQNGYILLLLKRCDVVNYVLFLYISVLLGIGIDIDIRYIKFTLELHKRTVIRSKRWASRGSPFYLLFIPMYKFGYLVYVIFISWSIDLFL